MRIPSSPQKARDAGAPKPRRRHLVAVGLATASLLAASLEVLSLTGVSVSVVTIHCVVFCQQESQTSSIAGELTTSSTPAHQPTDTGKKPTRQATPKAKEHRTRPHTPRPTQTTTVVITVASSPVSVGQQTSAVTPVVKKTVDRGLRLELRLVADMYSQGTIPMCAHAYDRDGHGVVVMFRPKLGTATGASATEGQPRLWCATYTAPSTSASEMEKVVVTVTDGVHTLSKTMTFPVNPEPVRP